MVSSSSSDGGGHLTSTLPTFLLTLVLVGDVHLLLFWIATGAGDVTRFKATVRAFASRLRRTEIKQK